MLASANDIGRGLAAKHDTDYGQRLKCLDAEMQLKFADCKDSRGEGKEAEAEHHSRTRDSADLPGVWHRRWRDSVSGQRHGKEVTGDHNDDDKHGCQD